MIRRICKYGESVLRERARKVCYSDIAGTLPQLFGDMRETMNAAGGIGLAAPQVGLSLRIVVLKIKEGEVEKYLELINPEIVARSGSQIAEEGCLSLPGLFVEIERFAVVKVKAFNLKNIPLEITAGGLLARALQHEVDHLNGKLIIDRVAPCLKPITLKRLRELRKHWLNQEQNPADERSV
ncbi:MAG TPA: peptide deformylase [Elusimicrobiales bacterium]|nr:peptide deformylase [Elusimicrobiales bacterium]